MHHLAHSKTGIEYFLENHRLALAATADYVAAVEDAGLAAHVIPDYMPGRDRIIGVRTAH